MTHFRWQLPIAVATLLISPGCASIVSGRRADVAFETYPANAHVTIHDRHGRAVTSFQTPGVASLKRQGKFFMPARYTATIEAPGHQPAQIAIASTLNPWILGNVLIGGIPGLAIDSVTGAAWKPKRAEIQQQLLPIAGGPQLPGYSANGVDQRDAVSASGRLAAQSPQKPATQTVRR